MYEAGLLSMGALAIILLAFGWAAWIFRGHRGDLSGLAIRREWTPFSDLEDQRWRDEHPVLVAPKQTDFEGRTTEEAWAYANPTTAQRAVSDMMRASMQHGQATVRERGEDE